MKVRYSLTFEFEENPSITVRGVVDAPTAQSCARDAIREAKNKHRGVNWQSLVVVLDKKGVE